MNWKSSLILALAIVASVLIVAASGDEPTVAPAGGTPTTAPSTYPVGTAPAASAPAEEKDSGLMPPKVVESASLIRLNDKTDPLPLLSVGRAPDNFGYQGAPVGDPSDLATLYAGNIGTKKHPLIDALVEKKSILLPAHKDHSTLVVLYGPSCSSGEAIVPTMLKRKGKVFALQADLWQDNRPRLRNIPSRQAWVISLGNLPAGKHELRLGVRSMFLDTTKGPGYQWQAQQNGKISFEVSDEKTAPETPPIKTTTLTMDDLKKVPLPAVAGVSWQRPVSYLRDLSDKELRSPILKVGTYALATVLTKKPPALKDLDVPGDGREIKVTCTAIAGPQLNSGEYMSLADVLWTDKTVEVTVEIWRDNEDRAKNIKRTPLLIVPLDTIGHKGEYTVKVIWQPLEAPAPGGLYKPVKDESLKPLEQKLTIEAK